MAQVLLRLFPDQALYLYSHLRRYFDIVVALRMHCRLLEDLFLAVSANLAFTIKLHPTT